MNEFETDVCVVLEARGMKLVPQVGCSNFRIDFGVCHPDEPGRFVMAIECDGATYHSSATARDRDRLRQQMLENLGWTFHRIWSTDWFLHREEEIQRAWHAYQRAVQKPAERRDVHQLSAKKSDDNDPPTTDTVAAVPRRNPSSSPIPIRSNIEEYSNQEIDRLYGWVTSDGILRTHDEIAAEMFRALPFSRRGARIEATIRRAIANRESTNREASRGV